MKKCAFDLGTKCAALTAKNCVECRFRKSKEELDKSREKSVNRLITLERERLNEIKKAYYSRENKSRYEIRDKVEKEIGCEEAV